MSTVPPGLDAGARAALALLPYVDEHSIAIGVADPLLVWRALGEVIERGWRAPRIATGLLRVQPAARSGSPLVQGSTLPGFLVAIATPGSELSLQGHHRFSRYALTFRIDAGSSGVTLCAETRAAFPGVSGQVYRALVIGTRGHVVIVRALLHATRRRAEGAGG